MDYHNENKMSSVHMKQAKNLIVVSTATGLALDFLNQWFDFNEGFTELNKWEPLNIHRKASLNLKKVNYLFTLTYM